MTQINTNIFEPGEQDDNILTPSITPPVPKLSKPAPVLGTEPEMRQFGDVGATRKAIYNQTMAALKEMEPTVGKTHTLRMTNAKWADPEMYSKAAHKQAVLTGETLGRRIKATWELIDNATGEVVDSRNQVVARAPYLTHNGTFVHNGNEYAIKNQQRLRPGLFTRVKNNGEIETHANVLDGGSSHRYFLDPEKGVFYIRAGQAKIPLLPLMRELGASDAELQKAWGRDIFATNYGKADASHLTKLKEKFGREGKTLKEVFEGMTLDPEVTNRTMGAPYDRLDKNALIATTKKLINVSKGESEPDDRDHLAYQTFLGPEDLIAERLRRDRAGIRRQLLYKAVGRGNLGAMPSSALQGQIDSTILESGLGQSLEEINPAEIFDKQTQISRLGEGGIPSLDAIPDEARAVQPSHMGFMDPLRTPESFRVGVDVHMARNARKGRDGKIYSQFKTKKGDLVWKTPQEAADLVVGFPGASRSKDPMVPAMKNGRITYVKRNNVDLELPHFENAFSSLGNLVPIKSMVKGQRVAMASRMLTQALPLQNAEAPLVQGAVPGMDGTSFEREYGTKMGAVRAANGGKVVSVSDDAVKVMYDNGKTEDIELYYNQPFNRKTFVHQTATVQPGQRFNAGDLLARSNFTDAAGETALGLNARVAYVPWAGSNFEDALVISEGMAKRLTSEHMYQHDLELTDKTKTGKKAFIGLFPSKYDKATLANFDDDGVIKPGTEINYGDPMILAAQEKSTAANKVHKKGKAAFNDASVTWKHHDPGVVTDVVKGKKGPVVLVKSKHPMQVGDKLSGRYGDKGVISKIIPDNQMPHDANGLPYEVLLNPLGVISRTNPAQMVEAALGKLARRSGKPIAVKDFDDVEDMTAWAKEQLTAAGLSDLEDIIDPSNDRKIKGVATGERFFMKLHHTAESKGQGRGSGGYSADDAPAKGGASGSKRLAMLDVNALLSHGATEVIRDASAVRGQKNEDYWLQFMTGNKPREPKVPLVYKKFVNELKASGINVVSKGSQTNILAMTDADVKELAGSREVTSGETVSWKEGLKPIKGGLFDEKLTGGHHGQKWAHIKLKEPLPNPVMEEPIRQLLGLTKKQMQGVIAGTETIPRFGSGSKAMQKALSSLNVDREIAVARVQIHNGTKGEKDKAIRRLGYLKAAKRLKMHPKDWMMTRVPVLPPQFRPINMIEGKDIPLVADPNFLYKDLIEANDNLGQMTKSVGADEVGEERLAVYNAFKAVTGLGEPITQKSQEKNIRGILKTVFGSSPKFGTVQRKLISSTVDNVGRAVITPNPDLDMDQVGLPEDKAFDVYQRFVARRLKRRGMPLGQALREIKDRSPLAKQMLMEEMEHRPVIINRAPVLHRFGIMAFKPQLTKGDVMQVSPLIVKGFGADFDGDAMNYHVPTTDESRKEALERMLPSRQLLSPADFKSPVHVPGQEYVGGLYHASANKSKRPVRTFAKKEDVLRAWARGDISVNDRIKIVEN